MPDDTQPTTPSIPQAPSAPVLPNPQDMVDAALSGDTAIPKPEVVETPKPETLPPLTPLSTPISEPAEPPVVAPTSAPATESVTPPTVEPVTPPVATAPAMAIGDDTPLAFAGMSAPTTTPTANADVNTPLTPPTTEGSSLPPVAPQVPEQKKKGKLGKVIAGVAILVITLIGGVFGYAYVYQSPLTIAKIIGTPTKPTCGPGETYNSKTGQCRPAPGTGDRGDANDPPPPIKPSASGSRPKDECDSSRPCGPNQRCKAGACVGIGTSTDSDPTNNNNDGDSCTTSDNKPGFIHGGVCVAVVNCSATDQGGAGCPAQCTAANAGWEAVQEPGGGTYCNAQGQQCSKYRKELKDPNGSTHCFIGYGEQCGGSCGGDTPPSAPPSTPTMACTGITSVPATSPAPTIGQTLTFTCAGTVTPSTAGTLSYKFRYSINNGTFTSMTNKTATTSELAISACGTYKVQCQACATLNGVLTCDPTWTAATQ